MISGRKVEVYSYEIVNGDNTSLVSYIGTFLGWGVYYEELESGPGNYTAAIVESDSGEIELVFAENIRFVA